MSQGATGLLIIMYGQNITRLLAEKWLIEKSPDEVKYRALRRASEQGRKLLDVLRVMQARLSRLKELDPEWLEDET